MSFAIDLKEYGPDLKKAYENVISSDPETTWAVFDYAASDNVLKPSTDGAGDLDEFVDAFDDARVQYGLAQVEFNSINKIVLIGWVGENVPSRQRLVFNAHMSAVAKQFPGHHVQITARSSDELSSATILDRVSAAAGSKYASATKPAPSTKPAYVTAKDGANEADWGDAQDVEERELQSGNGSGYRSSVRDELDQLRKGKKSSAPEKKSPARKVPQPKSDDEEEDDEREDKKSNGISGLDSGTSYKPVGKIDLKAIREAGKGSKFADARIEKIESSYKPVGKVDLKAIREQARKEKELKARKDDGEAPPAAASRPKSRASRDEDEDKDEDKDESEEEKPAPRSSRPQVSKASASKSDDEDEPQLGSLSDRMKAFQASIGAAKPKFDSSSRSSGPKSRSTPSSKLTEYGGNGSSTKRDSVKNSSSGNTSGNDRADSDEEEEAPLSVAAQLAKARLGGEKKDDSPPLPKRGSDEKKSSRPTPSAPKHESDKEEDEDEDKPKASVSTFAARFANKASSDDLESKSSGPGSSAKAPEPKKSVPKDDSEEEDKEDKEDEDVPPAPRRPGAGAAVKSPEPARTSESESKQEPKQKIEEEDDNAAEKGLVGIVKFEHEKEDDDEISLTVGEKITDIQEVDENWYLGRNSAGDVGLFPAEFVDIESKSSSAKSTPSASVKIAIAQYSYEAGDDDELEFEEGETIIDIEFPSEDWWSGKNSNGKHGLFPASYVTLQ